MLQKALDVLLPLASDIETFPVVFKLLATIRMIIDGQKEAAIKVNNLHLLYLVYKSMLLK